MTEESMISRVGLDLGIEERELANEDVGANTQAQAPGDCVGRGGKALLHWMNGPDVRAYFYGAQVVTPRDEGEFVALWKRAQQTTPPAPVHDGPAVLGPLPRSVAQRGDELKASRVFRETYELAGAGGLVEVRLDGQLVTPQVWVDEQYVDELVSSLPREGDDSGLFEFCFPIGQVGSPVLAGNIGTFASDRRGIGGLTPVRVARSDGDRTTLEFDVVARPNWISLTVVDHPGLGSKILIRNGVHRLLALHRGGRTRAFAMIQHGGIGEVGLEFNDAAIFKPNRLFAPRAPLLTDYLDQVTGTPISVFDSHQILRFAIASEIVFVPSQAQGPTRPGTGGGF